MCFSNFEFIHISINICMINANWVLKLIKYFYVHKHLKIFIKINSVFVQLPVVCRFFFSKLYLRLFYGLVMIKAVRYSKCASFEVQFYYEQYTQTITAEPKSWLAQALVPLSSRPPGLPDQINKYKNFKHNVTVCFNWNFFLKMNYKI